MIIQEYQSQGAGARKCYESALKSDPALQGRVTLAWTVNDQGVVAKAEIKDSEIPSSVFQKCVLGHLKGIQFSKAKRFTRAMVEYTMHFHKTRSQPGS